MEQPTYHRMNRLLIAQGLDYQTIERGIDGIDLEELEGHFKQVKLNFSIPFLVFTILWGIPIQSRTNGLFLT